MDTLTRLARIAATCCIAGWAIGSLAAWASWAAASHEHRYRIGRRNPS